MSLEEEKRISIARVQSKFENNDYDNGLHEYYEVLDRYLYQAGKNEEIVELLSNCLDNESLPKAQIECNLSQRLSRTMAEVYRVIGLPSKSIALLKWLLKSDETNERTKAIVCRNLGKILVSVGELEEAEQYLNLGANICQRIGEPGLETGLHRQLGIVHAYIGKFPESRLEINKHPKSFGKHSHSDFSVYSDKCLHALIDQNEFGKITYYSSEMRKLANKYPYKNDETFAKWLSGLAYLSTGDTDRAISLIDSALEGCRDSKYVEIQADLLTAKSRWVYLVNKDTAASMELAKNALKIAIQRGYKLKSGEIYCLLAELSRDHGDHSFAKEYGTSAFNSSWLNGPPYYYKNIVTRSKNILQSISELPPVRFSSCFISYSHADKEFALKLYGALDSRDIQCWLDDHEIRPGDYFPANIDEGIRHAEKVLLCCSQASLTSFWVDAEMDKALQKEEYLWKKNGARSLVMIPLDLDGYLLNGWTDPKSSVFKYRLTANFKNWKRSDEEFKAVVEKVVSALRVES